MLVIKKRPLSNEPVYFDYTNRLASGETLISCDAAPTMVLPSPANTDLTFTSLAVNSGGPLTPPSPSAVIATSHGVSVMIAGGVVPTDTSSVLSRLPDGTLGTVYEYSFSVTTSKLIGGVNRVIDENYQLWVSNDDYPAFWTSHWELNRRYSATAINQWADADNTGDSTAMLNNIWAAVDEATDDFQTQLRGSPCGLITPDIAKQSSALRRNCTMFAASILYRARGVRDTSDEEGRDRFSSDVKRVEKFIKQCRAGQRRLVDGDVGVTTHPFSVVTSQPYQSPFGPLLTPSQVQQANYWSEIQGVPSLNSWFNSFDTFWWGWPQ